MRPGILVARPPGRAVFRYVFTPTDAVWLGRLLAGAGAQYRGRRQSLLWSVLARFALYGRGAVSLSDFVRRFAPSLPRVPWQQLPRGARRLALAAFTGTLPGGDPSGVVRVVPRGYAPGQGSPYTYGSRMYGQGTTGYGQGGGQYGWSGEMEFEEPAPTPNTKPSPSPDEPAPTGADSQTSSPPPVDAGAPSMEPPPDDGGAIADGGDAGAEPPMGDEPAPPPASFDTQDGNRLVLNSDLMRRLMAAYRRRYPRWRYPYAQRWRYPYAGQRYPANWYQRSRVPGSWRQWPYGTRTALARPLALRRALVNRVARLAGGARRIGTLRGVRSGRRFPVFGGRVGGRNYRIVTRPRGRLQNEIMLVRHDKLAQELG